MFPSSFEYQRAGSVAEAIALLVKHHDAKLIAGGHSLLPAMKLRLAQPSLLIDISHIKDLQGIRDSGGGTVAIFALTTHTEVATSSLLPKAMRDAASQIGDMQVRNRGTLGGSISHADPAADYPAVLLALGAHLRAEGPGGSRVILADDFFTDLFTTALKPDEVLIGARFDAKPAGRTGTAYMKHPHPASGFAVVGVAAAVATDASGTITMARVAVTGACAKAQHLKATEAALAGKKFDAAAIKSAAAADNHLSCLSDSYASADYRAHLSGVLARRALESCLARLA